MTTVSFSGIDGAGKTTQIRALDRWLLEAGLSVQHLTFWDNIAAFSGFREYMSLRAFKGDAGVGSPEKPLERRDKNVTSWPVTAMRFCFYLADAVSLWWKVRSVRKSDADVIIFDRYIYDELANLPLNRKLTRWFVRLILRFVPKPDVALFLDADPDAARARKPEYPLEFLRSNRAAYLALSLLATGVTVIPPLAVAGASQKIREAYLQRLPQMQAGFSSLPALQ
jgi:thymidylate kinase